jgi:hypothetical protein
MQEINSIREVTQAENDDFRFWRKQHSDYHAQNKRR